MMNEKELLIQSLIDRETDAWNNRDVDTLVSLFHPDMVWPWPQNEHQHDPAHWVFPQGRYDRKRWKESWEELFRTHQLVHNKRKTVKIVVSDQGDGAFAVVDVDTLWSHRTTGSLIHWNGRACKGYTNVHGTWFLIFHTGLLDYSNIQPAE
jgi:ketosteroid isomerase-like protein